LTSASSAGGGGGKKRKKGKSWPPNLEIRERKWEIRFFPFFLRRRRKKKEKSYEGKEGEKGGRRKGAISALYI